MAYVSSPSNSIFVWRVVGIPSAATSCVRHSYQLRASPFSSVFVWPCRGTTATPPTPPATEVPTHGSGPGWNLFHDVPARVRVPETLERDVRDAYARATGEATEPQRDEAVREIAALADEAVQSSDARIVEFAERIQSLRELQTTGTQYLQAVGELIAMQKQHEDDLEAFKLIAQLA